jgi:hypothetical protein
MRSAASIFGLMIVTSLLGCELNQVPPAPTFIAPFVPFESAPDARELLRAATDCMLTSVYYHPPSGASYESVASGSEAMSCIKAGHAIHIRPVRLYRLDADAIFEVRRAITQSPGTAYSPRQMTEMVSFFDKAVAAIAEGKRAHSALIREAPDLGRAAVDKVRAHAMIVGLDDFGRGTGTLAGVEARAVAMLIAGNNFLYLARVRTAQRPFAAEPLFTMMFGSEFLSNSADEAPASWADYVGAAARAAEQPPAQPQELAPEDALVDPWATVQNGSARPAVGGGPSDQDERATLRAVTGAVEVELRSLSDQLPAGDLRSAVERTISHFAALDVEAVISNSGRADDAMEDRGSP